MIDNKKSIPAIKDTEEGKFWTDIICTYLVTSKGEQIDGFAVNKSFKNIINFKNIKQEDIVGFKPQELEQDSKLQYLTNRNMERKTNLLKAFFKKTEIQDLKTPESLESAKKIEK